ncbi:hypothetical protein OEA41_000978 [Lepraria neglecta]|uniref:Rieske domain-containing protein n=1 Tax=Lepraria neglecta TaxID=209136 RepID=A0AAE0DQ00_9LECA|nr:hypothetical protein OEA41_000978 [Lepraria neglecta]
MATMATPEHALNTSGDNDPVWVHREPYSNRPRFPKLTKDTQTEVCVIGSGIAGVSTAYELVSRGVPVALIEARDVVSGESGRTSGHLSNALDASYTELASKHGESGSKVAAESHTWALKRVGEISQRLRLDCEYRTIPDYEISQYERGDPKHDEEMTVLQEDVKKAKELGVPASYEEGYAIKGWDGLPDQRDVAIFKEQATFHPTMYITGVLRWLAKQPNFACYTRTRMVSIEEKGFLSTAVKITTLDGHTITCKDAVEATCIPLQKLSVVAQLEYLRTYCIAVRVPKNSIEDCLINDQAVPYKYVRFTACDDENDYLVIGGCDHKVGQEQETGRFAELESWVRARFTKAGSVDYRWSGQILDSTDLMAFIGLNQGKSHTYIVTGDTGHGLTMGVLAGKLIADEIQGVGNPWSKAYSPNRLPPASSVPGMLAHDLQINSQYKRFLQSDIADIEDLAPRTGGVIHPTTKAPVAVYKDDDGKVHRLSALCPHLQGVVCWNNVEKSWDCPVHGSRFSKDGICVMGPAKAGLAPMEEASEKDQKRASRA